MSTRRRCRPLRRPGAGQAAGPGRSPGWPDCPTTHARRPRRRVRPRHGRRRPGRQPRRRGDGGDRRRRVRSAGRRRRLRDAARRRHRRPQRQPRPGRARSRPALAAYAVAAVCADLPALRAEDLDAALAMVPADGTGFVADMRGDGHHDRTPLARRRSSTRGSDRARATRMPVPAPSRSTGDLAIPAPGRRRRRRPRPGDGAGRRPTHRRRDGPRRRLSPETRQHPERVLRVLRRRGSGLLGRSLLGRRLLGGGRFLAGGLLGGARLLGRRASSSPGVFLAGAFLAAASPVVFLAVRWSWRRSSSPASSWRRGLLRAAPSWQAPSWPVAFLAVVFLAGGRLLGRWPSWPGASSWPVSPCVAAAFLAAPPPWRPRPSPWPARLGRRSLRRRNRQLGQLLRARDDVLEVLARQ